LDLRQRKKKRRKNKQRTTLREKHVKRDARALDGIIEVGTIPNTPAWRLSHI
jgi:hypothetical protein